MSQGLPIIASDYAGSPELVENGYNGILVEPNDVSKLSEEIYNLILDKDKRDRYGKNNLQLYEERLSKDVILKNYQRIFTRYTA